MNQLDKAREPAIRPKDKPRGFYAVPDPLSKDKTKQHLEGPMVNFVWPITKTMVLAFFIGVLHSHGLSAFWITFASLALVLSY